MTQKIKIEQFPDPNFRVYHTTVVISQSRSESFWIPLRPKSDRYLEEVGEVGATLVREVMALLGVGRVEIRPYEFTVEKGTAYDWEEIEPQVIEALKKTFGETEEEIVVIPHPLPVPEPASEVAPEKPQKGFWQRFLGR